MELMISLNEAQLRELRSLISTRMFAVEDLIENSTRKFGSPQELHLQEREDLRDLLIKIKLALKGVSDYD